ncbi:helix-turn-helix domain-containing protein [Phytomonospora endophytica]|uniref:DUF5753 domain-containing protein n=1 Tax=Phytomonospora endophytica TaxID=714109 RepID=A0A841FTU4_9ACTN|nr:helix-turn-helix transcriptional regulator [Phytomonospora endophytica]MBB6035949.1 hypothetical protein [Phytomonospora endophytica]GIG66854.1 transcriptional regulator [Phytomonospora endophytica]
MSATNPTVSLRALGFRLRAHRLASTSDTRLEPAAKVASISPGSLSRAENGKQALNPVIVERILDHYGVADEEERQRCIELARQGRKRAWWAKYTDLVNSIYIGLEGGASRICYLESLVPGLLQTPAYIEALVQSEFPGVTRVELDRRIEVRMERQQILLREDRPCELVAVLDESIFARPIGSPEVMAEQLDHLLKMAERPNIEIQIMPFSAGAHGSLGARYAILRFADADDPGTVYLEQLHWRDTFIEEPEDVRRFADAFESSRATAEPPSRSLALIKKVRDDFRKQGKE